MGKEYLDATEHFSSQSVTIFNCHKVSFITQPFNDAPIYKIRTLSKNACTEMPYVIEG